MSARLRVSGPLGSASINCIAAFTRDSWRPPAMSAQRSWLVSKIAARSASASALKRTEAMRGCSASTGTRGRQALQVASEISHLDVREIPAIDGSDPCGDLSTQHFELESVFLATLL